MSMVTISLAFLSLAALQMFALDEPEESLFTVKYIALAEKEADFSVEITEPEVSLFTERHIRSLFEIL